MGNAYEPDHSIYAQAGFPGYQNYPTSTQFTQAPYTQFTQAPYQPLESEVHDRIRSNIDAIMENQKSALTKLISSEDIKQLSDRVDKLSRNLHDKSNDPIQSLSDKVDRLLGDPNSLSDKVDDPMKRLSDIKRLSDRVDMLSRHIDGKVDKRISSDQRERISSDSVQSLSDKVEKLSRNIELSQQSEISQRLRRLAEESKESVSNW
jgi:hypothetical protein